MADSPRPEPTDEERLLSFLRGRDVACPLCGYNLRDLTKPVCPECRQQLELSVGVRDVTLGWFIATITPMTFSGLCAIVLGVAIVIAHVVRDYPPPMIYVLDGFGWFSGLVGVVLLIKRIAFLGLPRNLQVRIAFAVWAVHILALLAFLLKVWGLM